MERNTIQRDIVMTVLKKLNNHATADEIYAAVRHEHPAISRSTVYRNLQWFCDKGQLRKREIPGQADVYDQICTNHYHVRCSRCGRIFDVDMDYIPGLEQAIKDPHGFRFTGHDIIFTGVCPDCQSRDEPL
ncbi:MAG: transcriptional repressor [Oscillospiraceae bacterium]|nr:transcriptional repressor [Oscillospiraceae bacterium]